MTILSLRNGSVIIDYEVVGDSRLREKHTMMVVEGELDFGAEVLDFGVKGQPMLMKDGIVKGVCNMPQW